MGREWRRSGGNKKKLANVKEETHKPVWIKHPAGLTVVMRAMAARKVYHRTANNTVTKVTHTGDKHHLQSHNGLQGV